MIASAFYFIALFATFAGAIRGILWIEDESNKTDQTFGRLYGKLFGLIVLVKGFALFTIWALPEVLTPFAQVLSFPALSPEFLLLPFLINVRRSTPDQWMKCISMLAAVSSLVLPAIIVGWKLSNTRYSRRAQGGKH